MIEKILLTATEYFFYNQVSRKSFFLRKKSLKKYYVMKTKF